VPLECFQLADLKLLCRDRYFEQYTALMISKTSPNRLVTYSSNRTLVTYLVVSNTLVIR